MVDMQKNNNTTNEKLK